MKYKELKSKTEAEIRKTLEDLRVEAHDLLVKLRLNQLKNTHKLKAVRKDIARILTYLHNFK
jgi:large subunit ribosomal protein L29